MALLEKFFNLYLTKSKPETTVCTTESMIECLKHYRSYPTMIIPSRMEPDEFKFPTITVCQNSLHDKTKIERNLPFMSDMIGK